MVTKEKERERGKKTQQHPKKHLVDSQDTIQLRQFSLIVIGQPKKYF
jgi:hypothetical protein